MIITKDISSLRQKRREEKNQSWGFVPTMGFLHEGHFSLMRKAQKENDACVVSIFINVKQFNDPSDFDNYPQDLERDIEALEKLGVDIVFIPDQEIMYPVDFMTDIKVKHLSEILEGASRPGHFDGVCAIVAKLFNIVQPERAYFGRKDAQQLLIIKKMVDDLNFDVKIVPCSTYREKNGLAMSSRNARLSPEQRQKASVLRESLKLAKKLIAAGERNAGTIKKAITDLISVEPLAKIDIVSVNKANTLEDIKLIEGDIVIFLAAYFGSVRLIDNIFLSV